MRLTREQKELLLRICKNGVASKEDRERLETGQNRRGSVMYLTYRRDGESVIWEENYLELERMVAEPEEPITLSKAERTELLKAGTSGEIDEASALWAKLAQWEQHFIYVLHIDGDRETPEPPARYKRTSRGTNRIVLVVGSLEDIRLYAGDGAF